MKTREVIYSPGYGAGWWTWYSGPISFDDFCCHPIMVEAVKNGEFKNEKETESTESFKGWKAEMMDKYAISANEWRVYIGGLDQAVVGTFSGKVKINEYDGYESIICQNDDKEFN